LRPLLASLALICLLFEVWRIWGEEKEQSRGEELVVVVVV
jgi:hypothetical protein